MGWLFSILEFLVLSSIGIFWLEFCLVIYLISSFISRFNLVTFSIWSKGVSRCKDIVHCRQEVSAVLGYDFLLLFRAVEWTLDWHYLVIFTSIPGITSLQIKALKFPLVRYLGHIVMIVLYFEPYHFRFTFSRVFITYRIHWEYIEFSSPASILTTNVHEDTSLISNYFVTFFLLFVLW